MVRDSCTVATANTRICNRRSLSRRHLMPIFSTRYGAHELTLIPEEGGSGLGAVPCNVWPVAECGNFVLCQQIRDVLFSKTTDFYGRVLGYTLEDVESNTRDFIGKLRNWRTGTVGICYCGSYSMICRVWSLFIVKRPGQSGKIK